MNPSTKLLRLGTRGSLLARMQSELIANQLRALQPGLIVELIIIKTTGDRIQDRPLHEVGGKGLFTKELEQALLANEIDFAVHSYKDVPVTMPLVDIATLTIAAVPLREEVCDVLVTANGCRRIIDLPPGARIGTGSLRRRAQLLAIRSDLSVAPIRGNIDTRIRKLRDRELDALILAAAGLKRANLFDSATMTPIETVEMVPSPGQGALALQCRSNDIATVAALKSLDHAETSACIRVERELVRLLQADCHSPLGIYARIINGQIELAASVGAHNGAPPLIVTTIRSGPNDIDTLARRMFATLCERGAMTALHPM